MSEYVDFHYMPLEGKITGKQVLKQTEDAINDLGEKVYSIDIDSELIQEAIDTSNQAIDTAEAALSAVTTNRAMWFNTVAEMKATDIALGITAATRGKGVFNDGDGAFYAIRAIKGGDVDSDDTVFLDNGNVAERIKQFNLIAKGNNYFSNVAELRASDAVVGLVYGTMGYHFPNDGGNGFYVIRAKEVGDTDDGGSIIILDNGNVAELIVDGKVDVKQFGAYGDGVHDDTTAIQNALDYGYSIENTGESTNSGGRVFKVTCGAGFFLVTNTISINSSCELSQMNLWADGTAVSPVLAVGSTSGVSIYSKTLKLPNVFNYKNGSRTTKWDGTGVGVELRNINNSNIYVAQITGFSVGLCLNPTSGNAYNNYFLQAITYCQVCLKNTRTGSGWSNENIFNGGRFVASKNSSNSWAGTRQILIEQGSNNLYIKPSLESTNVEYSIEMDACTYITFLQPRYEGAGAKRILFNASAQYGVSRITFIGGYQLASISSTDTGSYPPAYVTIIDTERMKTRALTLSDASGLIVGRGAFSSDDTEYHAKLNNTGLSLKYTKTNSYDSAFLGTNSIGKGLYFPAEATPDGGNDYSGGAWMRPLASAMNWAFNKKLLPSSSGTIDIGSSSYLWKDIYATNGTIQTSDEREKQDIEPIEDAVFRAWSKVNFVQFRFKDAVAKKGDGARIHCGLIAQQVKEAFESEGLDAFRYGLLCYDEWDDEYEDVEQEDGTIEHRKITEAGNRYGIRYEEALALECAYQRWLANNK